MRVFTFTGTSTIQRKFKIDIAADNYEKAQEIALDLLEDVDDSEYYTMGDDEVEIEVDEVEESSISSRMEDREHYPPVA